MKLQTTIGFLAVLASICFAGHLTLGLFKGESATFPFGKLAQLENQKTQLVATIADERIQLPDLDPGPEPSWWWHPSDHLKWTAKADLYHKSIEMIEHQDSNLSEIKAEIERYGKDFWPKVFGTVWAFIRWSWCAFIMPILHIFLILTLMGFSTRVVFRWMLITNKLGTTRV